MEGRAARNKGGIWHHSCCSRWREANTVMFHHTSNAPEAPRVLVYADSVSEAESLAESLTSNYGCVTAAVASSATARHVLLEGRFDVLVSHAGNDDLSWVTEVAPTVAVVALGRVVPPKVPRLLLVPQWPQPVGGLMERIQHFLQQRAVNPENGSPPRREPPMGR